MSDLIYFRDKLKEHKNYCVNRQFFEDATNWRDAERILDKVIRKEESLKNFFQHIKREKYSNFDEIYEIVKPLEITFQRKQKIEKLYNNF